MSERAHGIRRVLFSVLRVILGTYVGVVLVMFFLQDHLIFVPDRAVGITPADVGLPFEQVKLKTSDDVTLSAWFVPADNARAIVLFCHGNAGNLSDRVSTIEVLHDLGLEVFIFDYRGYGDSEGKPTEKGVFEDAETAWKYLTEERSIPSDRIIIVGRSLGGAVGAHLARDHTPRGLIIENAFTSLVDIARVRYPWLPVRLMLRARLDTVAYLSQVKCPVLVVHSPEDEIIPYWMGQKLFEAAPEPKQFVETAGGHNEGCEVADEVYTGGWQKFLESLSLTTESAGDAACHGEALAKPEEQQLIGED